MFSAIFMAALGCFAVRYLYKQGRHSGFPEVVMFPIAVLGLIAMTFGSMVFWWDQVKKDAVGSPGMIAADVAVVPVILCVVLVGLWTLLGTDRAMAIVTLSLALVRARPTSHTPSLPTGRVASWLELTPRDFERSVAYLLTRLGWRDVRLVGAPGDMGCDITAVDPDGLRVMVQCKRYAPGSKVDSRAVQTLIGMAHHVHDVDRLLVVTTSGFTLGARTVAESSGGFATLWDGLSLDGLSASVAPDQASRDTEI